MTHEESPHFPVSIPVSLWSKIRKKHTDSLEEFIRFAKNEKKQVSWISIQLQVVMLKGKHIRFSWGKSKVGLFAFFLELTATPFVKWEKSRVYRKVCLTEMGGLYGPQQEPAAKLKDAKIQLLFCAKRMLEHLQDELPDTEICLFDINGKEITDLCQIILTEAERLGICEKDRAKLCQK
jgi:hypothetical protein